MNSLSSLPFLIRLEYREYVNNASYLLKEANDIADRRISIIMFVFLYCRDIRYTPMIS